MPGLARKTAAPSASEKTPAGPRRGGTVVTGWTAEPRRGQRLILPASQMNSEVQYRMFLHLVEEQPDFQDHPPTFKPLLAKSYEWSADHKILTFRLREDVVWSDGVPVTAEDVRWTWQAQIHPDVAWEGADSKRWITDVEVVDPHTVRFHFERAYAKQLLDANECPILPKHAWEKLPFSQWRQNNDWFRQHLVVDGPFTHRLLGAAAAGRPGAQRPVLREGAALASTAWCCARSRTSPPASPSS